MSATTTNVVMAISSIASALFALILCIVTCFYVFLTNQLVKESADNRKSSFLPIITMSRIGRNRISIKNTGRGLAQDVHSDSDLINLNFFDVKSFFCPDEDKDFPNLQDRLFEFLKRDMGCFNIFYKDIYGRECTTKVKFNELGDYSCVYIAPGEKNK